MSIIYDALKRIESKEKGLGQGQESPGVQPRRRPKQYSSKFAWLVYLAFLAIVIVLVQFLSDKASKGPALTQTSAQKPSHIQMLPTQPGSQSEDSLRRIAGRKLPNFYLTGIMLAEGQHTAIINDQVVRQGDVIEGATIDKIDSEGVEITFGDSSFRINYSQ